MWSWRSSESLDEGAAGFGIGFGSGGGLIEPNGLDFFGSLPEGFESFESESESESLVGL